MKKKVLSIALVVALIAIMVSGTLAYFTAEDKVTNTFTIGSVDIEIYENEQPTDEDTIAFTDPLVPIVNVDDPSEDESYMVKAVDVMNTGINDAYIRTHIAIPSALDGYLKLDVNIDNGWRYLCASAATVDGVEYKVFTYDYADVVASGDRTPKLLNGVYLDSKVDLKTNPAAKVADLYFCTRNDAGELVYSTFVAHKLNADGSYTTNTVNVLVASEAIQAQGFNNATDALNSGFGFETNPWK